jgi:hypothetical protein
MKPRTTRWRKRRQPSISLFPFLSVLVAVLGVLILLISGLSLVRFAYGSTPPEVQLDELRGTVRAGQEEVQRLQTRLAQGERVRADLAAARAELEEAQRTHEQDQQLGKQPPEALGQEAEELRRRISGLEPQLADLRQKLSALPPKREESGTDPQASTPIVLLPGRGRADGIQPQFAECAGDVLLLYRQPGSPPDRIRRGDVWESKEFQSFLNQVKSAHGARVIFLIRPDGVGTYDEASRRARSMSVTNGKLPLPGTGPIDWGAFGDEPS